MVDGRMFMGTYRSPGGAARSCQTGSYEVESLLGEGSTQGVLLGDSGLTRKKKHQASMSGRKAAGMYTFGFSGETSENSIEEGRMVGGFLMGGTAV